MLQIVAFRGNEMSKDTRVSLGNGGEPSVATAEDEHVREDWKSEGEVTEQVGPPGEGPAKAMLKVRVFCDMW